MIFTILCVRVFVCDLSAVCVRFACGLCADLCAVCVRTLCAEEMSRFRNEFLRTEPRVRNLNDFGEMKERFISKCQ